jgi:eukaryotic-like serine/threonine-protein kinase
MHNKGIIHRDITPAHIFVCTSGRAVITDLFVAKIIRLAQPLPRSGSVIGTPSYMSPEQVMGLTPDGRGDLFSLGCVLYEMVVGEKAFRDDTFPAIAFSTLKEEPGMRPIPDGPACHRLRGVILRALRKKPEDRYPNAPAMRADLELARNELGDSADWTPLLSRKLAGTC